MLCIISCLSWSPAFSSSNTPFFVMLMFTYLVVVVSDSPWHRVQRWVPDDPLPDGRQHPLEGFLRHLCPDRGSSSVPEQALWNRRPFQSLSRWSSTRCRWKCVLPTGFWLLTPAIQREAYMKLTRRGIAGGYLWQLERPLKAGSEPPSRSQQRYSVFSCDRRARTGCHVNLPVTWTEK